MNGLTTEDRLPQSSALDTLSVSQITSLMNQEDQKVPKLVEAALPQLNLLIESIILKMQNGGRLIYIGAGTSGRLGVLDAVECVPTFGVSPNVVKGLIAGGEKAFVKAVEGAEDREELAIEDLKAIALTENDAVVGLAASGRTPYAIGGLTYANHIGALTGSIACNKNAEISKYATFAVEVPTGAEVLTGSTRLKAGTAQKLLVNMLSTCVMIKQGKVYENLMVDVQATNEKLVNRAIRIIMQSTGCDKQLATRIFFETGKQTKVAIVRILLNLSNDEAKKVIAENGGFIRRLKTDEQRKI